MNCLKEIEELRQFLVNFSGMLQKKLRKKEKKMIGEWCC